ncbi:hypothetical protein HHK36_007895 [Tetracentron sinense]|uniref:ATP synthase subunit beta, mitochondrial n=1 Tax=Tetracentron sinense TaxID=13715 RepID=A0A834ZIK5_TETSI|nr:hypothetical protein HHK36_007895 [Tetracentron sinense]
MLDTYSNLVYDYMGGMEDISKAIVRTVIPVSTSFLEDCGEYLIAILHVLRLDKSDSKRALVYGQMNEPLGARVEHTVAEHFRDVEGQDVLLFIDNIFRFTQVSVLLGSIPSAVGYQPTLAIDLGGLESGEMCAMKELTLFSDDLKSQESAKQLGQVDVTKLGIRDKKQLMQSIVSFAYHNH